MPVGLRTNSMAVGMRAARIPASWPAAVGSTGALKPAVARVAAIRSRSAASKRTNGVNDSWRTLSVTPCSSQKPSEAERTVVTISSTVASCGARASSQARTAEGTAFVPFGSTMTLPNVATAALSAAAWRAASAVAA